MYKIILPPIVEVLSGRARMISVSRSTPARASLALNNKRSLRQSTFFFRRPRDQID